MNEKVRAAVIAASALASAGCGVQEALKNAPGTDQLVILGAATVITIIVVGKGLSNSVNKKVRGSEEAHNHMTVEGLKNVINKSTDFQIEQANLDLAVNPNNLKAKGRLLELGHNSGSYTADFIRAADQGDPYAITYVNKHGLRQRLGKTVTTTTKDGPLEKFRNTPSQSKRK